MPAKTNWWKFSFFIELNAFGELSCRIIKTGLLIIVTSNDIKILKNKVG